jgi:hypothetical protein
MYYPLIEGEIYNYRTIVLVTTWLAHNTLGLKLSLSDCGDMVRGTYYGK